MMPRTQDDQMVSRKCELAADQSPGGTAANRAENPRGEDSSQNTDNQDSRQWVPQVHTYGSPSRPLRILYVSQYFPPEMGAPSARVFELSREWVKQGHDVTVLTGFPNHPTGKKKPADEFTWSRWESPADHAGIRVLRAWLWATPNAGVIKRMLSYASFMAGASAVGVMQLPRPDIVIGTSPQLLCATAAYFLARWFNVPFVFEVRDLWPESILAVDAMRDNLVVRGLKKLARHLYFHADRVVTVGAGYQRKIHELYGLPLDAMRVVPNGIDTRLFVPGEKDEQLLREYDLQGKRVVLYLGTHGMAHALDNVLAAARLLQTKAPDVVFAFVGEGAEKARLQALAAEWQLRNVRFIAQQPKERVPVFYRSCDLGLVSLRDTPLFQEVLPSKLFEYLAMERPVVMTVGGEAKRVLESAQAGVYVPPEQPEPLADAIQTLLADAAQRKAMGEAGRAYVLREYDRAHQATHYLSILAALQPNAAQAPSTELMETNRG